MVMEMSKTYQYRKVMKPLLERKRRARINKCLDDLKDLVVECLQQDGEHVTRLEKADILELTVELMRKLKQRGRLSLGAQPNLQIESFRSGYVHAADQITQVLLQQRQTDEVGQKIVKFLSSRLVDLQNQLVNSTTAATATVPTTAALPTATTTSSIYMPSVNINPLSIPYSFMESDSSSEAGESEKGQYFAPPSSMNSSENQLIDVTTIEDKLEKSEKSIYSEAAEENSDSNSEPEQVWRPW